MSFRPSSAQIVLGVASALVLLASLFTGLSYLNGQEQRSRLVEQHRGLEQALQQLQAQPPGAGAGEAPFPRNPPGVALTDVVVRAARESGAEVLGLHSSAVGSEPIGSSTYRTVRVSLRLRGDSARVADFLARVERGGVSTLVVDNLEVAARPEPASGGDVWEVSVELLAYAQGG